MLALVGLAAFWLNPILGVIVLVAGAFVLRTVMDRCDNQGAHGDDVIGEIGDGGVSSDLQIEGTSLDTASPRSPRRRMA